MRLIRTGEDSGDLELARQVVALAEAAHASLAKGGAPVRVAHGPLHFTHEARLRAPQPAEPQLVEAQG